MILEKQNAVLDNRDLMGATNPKDAKEGTIRKKYGISIDKNSVHGSDSLENAKLKLIFFLKIKYIFFIALGYKICSSLSILLLNDFGVSFFLIFFFFCKIILPESILNLQMNSTSRIFIFIFDCSEMCI